MSRMKLIWKRKFTVGDPMLRFLCESKHSGYAAPMYHQQWQTYFKAQRLGYITDDDTLATITDKGLQFIEDRPDQVKEIGW